MKHEPVDDSVEAEVLADAEEADREADDARLQLEEKRATLRLVVENVVFEVDGELVTVSACEAQVGSEKLLGFAAGNGTATSPC